jgi:hypothetical protein
VTCAGPGRRIDQVGWFWLVLDHARLHRRCLIAAPLT